jgi:hypothetical protein
MAITINGSGTISGISAGGLPDGSVTADDLASGAITSDALPAGTVIQVVTNRGSGGSGTTSSSWVPVDCGVTITPKYSNSVLFIHMTATAYVNADIGFFSIARNGTLIGTATGSGLAQQNPSGSTAYQPSALSTYDSPNTTSAVEYKVYVKNNSSGQTYFPPGGADQWTATVWEIAA